MADGQEFRKDQIAKNYTQDSWNQMYNNAAKNADALTKLWNQIYTNPSNAAVLFYNKMYMAVASGKSLEDPELQAEIRAWNAQGKEEEQMITPVNERCLDLRGLSTDKKPLKKDYSLLGNGSTFLEMDTAMLWMYDEQNDRWLNITKAQLGIM